MRLGKLWWSRGYRVPEGYLDDEVGRVRMQLIGQIEVQGMTRWLLMKPMTCRW